MAHYRTWPDEAPVVNSLHSTLLAFPIACFSLTLLTDIAYWYTLNLMWLHFSEWLLLAGLVFGVLAIVALVIDYFVRRVRPRWSTLLSGVAVLILATINSFVHTADGWTAIMPWGLTLSVLTVLMMLVTGWSARTGVRHV